MHIDDYSDRIDRLSGARRAVIGVLYEHPEWFRPLFAELDRRDLAWEGIQAHQASFDPAATGSPYDLVVNRVSPSSYLRDHTSAIFFAHEYLAHLEKIGVPVVNGTAAYRLETSKARQLALLQQLRLPHPRSVVVNDVRQIAGAAARLRYPVMVKPNIGGSGALMQRFDSPAQLSAAVGQARIDLGLDRIGIVQEYHPPLDGSIVRVEVLDGRFLYAIRIETDPDQGFNLCPADICQVDAAPEAGQFDLCLADAPAKRALKIEAFTPPREVIEAAVRICRAGQLDIAGVEYLESSRDHSRYFYDINALSNFVTDAPRLVGFDPFARFADYLEERSAARAQEVRPETSARDSVDRWPACEEATSTRASAFGHA